MERRLRERLEAIHLHTQVVGMEEVEGGIRVELSGLRVEEPVRTYAKVLVCVGRRPATDGLGLETTKARVDARGFVRTDAQRRSDDPALFVVGDAAGEPMLAHKASYEARRAVEVIAGRPEAADAQAVPAVMFTDPEVAWAGLTETKAKAEHIPVRVLRFPWGASGRAKTLNRREGLTKILVDPPTHRILGVGVVGPGAGELLAEGAFAIETGARVEDLSLTVHAHPTLSETLMEAAESFFGSSTHFAGRM
jgi:dihydrolipoamide dehydrogenase